MFNTLQTNSAAHVPNTNMNLINEDTHICDPNLYETIFQNVCLIDGLSSITPTHDANACCETSKDPSFTDSKSTHLGDAPSEDNSRGIKITHFTLINYCRQSFFVVQTLFPNFFIHRIGRAMEFIKTLRNCSDVHSKSHDGIAIVQREV